MRPRWLVVLCIPVLTACAAIPTSGPIQQGTPVGADPNDQVIRVIARPPQPGMSPSEIVQGFLDASASFEGDHAVARQYLTDAADSMWRPASNVTVYDGILDVSAGGTTSVRASASLYGTIDGDGMFRVATPPRTIPIDFRVQQVDDEWRIADAPEGLLLSRSDVERSFRAYSLYFFNSTFEALVPDPRMFPIQDTGLATTLVRALVAGPSDWLAPAVRTAVPDGTTLSIDAVPVESGVARIDLDQRMLLTDDDTRRALSAQIVWTLRQVPDVAAVDIRSGGQSLPVGGVFSPQSRDTWMSYNPDAPPFPASGFVIAGSRAMRIMDQTSEAIPGGAGSGDPALSEIAVASGGSQIAGLDQLGTLWRGNIAEDSIMTQVLDEPGLSHPNFDGLGNVWVLGADGVPRVASPIGTVSRVTVEDLPSKATVLGMSLAPDDARMALVVQRGPRRVLMLARVVTKSGSFVIAGARRVESVLTDVRAVGWDSSHSIAVLGTEGAGQPQVYAVDLNGGRVVSAGSPEDPLTLAAAPGLPTLVATGSMRVFALVGGQWESRPYGASPAYAH